MLKFSLLLVLLWLPSLIMGIDDLADFFAWRHQLTMLTGFLSLGYMCLAVLLAARFRWVEFRIRGLDKGYQLHKKLGIAATVSLIVHWLVINSAKWLIEAELISRPNRQRAAIEGINWHALAESVGDIAFKVFLVFSLISLIQAISYNKFKFTHKIAGILVFAGIFHSLLLLGWNIQSAPINIAIALMSIIGIYCSWLSLTGKTGKNNRSTGQIIAVERFVSQSRQNAAVRFSARLDSEIRYKEGQFSYLNFHDGESAHPFSILNYDSNSNVIEFGVKDLGDYSNKLVNNLKTGQKVTVEGGYGCFQISDFENQAWVGAGIGIVPFISRLYWLKNKADNHPFRFQKIHLFYCVNSKKEAFFADEIVSILGHLHFIELHILEAEKGELLDSEQIIQKMEGEAFDVSFCGPVPFAEKLKKTLRTNGLPESRFHHEIFKMR